MQKQILRFGPEICSNTRRPVVILHVGSVETAVGGGLGKQMIEHLLQI